MADRFVGDITATRRADGSIRLQVAEGPLRVSRELLEHADPEFVSQAEDVITFHGIADDGTHQAYRYRVVGSEAGPEGGWLLCEPVL